ncbi:hypothetical protein OsJ_00749 [Oryza sativa Japonica Group]|uniref:Uncharacterized protein n=1 Tax=Oryza sativa subsp. japonica TaxID=39947 RepID=B9ETN4_ORYSJ|nr:hypothetical protein OsJ_00749 [Oryza sativa Japonica Group]
MEPGFGKRLMHVLRAVYHMLRRGLCRKRLMMDLHLLLGRGKLAGQGAPRSSAGRGGSRHAGGGASNYGGLDASAVARVFEMLNADAAAAAGAGGETPLSSMPGATPSPLLALSLGRSPAGTRQLRVTDSPFPVEPPEGAVDGRVDDKATDFIEWFRRQLLQQQASAAPTPDYRG